ncbi:hypothetical protein ACFWQ1_28345 [Streptomyces albidoflavus]|uniref:hypothetical protein n=1 Tax=Streptomyces sp. CNQ431 TaxID=1571532 RepID=UPI0012FEBCA3|nr:hypothetical protein [Streptomyces sp. CNQ431]
MTIEIVEQIAQASLLGRRRQWQGHVDKLVSGQVRNARLRNVVREDSDGRPVFEERQHQSNVIAFLAASGPQAMQGLLEVALIELVLPDRRTANLTSLAHEEITTAQTVPMKVRSGHGNNACGTDIDPAPLHRPVAEVWLALAGVPGGVEHFSELYVKLLPDCGHSPARYG